MRLSKLAIFIGLASLASPGPLSALTNSWDYHPHGWQTPPLYGARKIADQMVDFDPTVHGEETRWEETILSENAGRAIRLSHNGRVFCYIVDHDLMDPWDYQVVDHDGSGGFELREPAFSDFPLPRWTFINHPFLTVRPVDYTDGAPTVEQLVAALSGKGPDFGGGYGSSNADSGASAGSWAGPCIPKYTPEQRAAMTIARGGTPPPDECLPLPAEAASAPRVALNILFDFDQDTLTSQARSTLNTLGRAMTSPGLAGSTFRLEGHTDARGGFDYNMDLSRRRAYRVQSYLAENFNIPTSQLVAAGQGESVPLPNVDPEDGRNRRVEVINLTAQTQVTSSR